MPSPTHILDAFFKVLWCLNVLKALRKIYRSASFKWDIIKIIFLPPNPISSTFIWCHFFLAFYYSVTTATASLCNRGHSQNNGSERGTNCWEWAACWWHWWIRQRNCSFAGTASLPPNCLLFWYHNLEKHTWVMSNFFVLLVRKALIFLHFMK